MKEQIASAQAEAVARIAGITDGVLRSLVVKN